jgi:hypothetical protein
MLELGYTAMPRVVPSTACVLVLFATVSCKSSSGTVDVSADASVDAGDVGAPLDVSELAAAICQASEACVGCPMPDCVAKIESGFPARLPAGRTFDPAVYADCVAAYRAYGANDCGPNGVTCGSFIIGGGVPGSPCTEPTDCDPGQYHGVRCDNGRCVAFNYYGEEGQACGQIAPYVEQLCTNNSVALYCKTSDGDQALSTEKGTCMKVPSGAPIGGSCVGKPCEGNAVCDPATSTCVAQRVGESCTITKTNFGDQDNCVPDAYCADGICVAKGKLHDPCTSLKQCAAPLACVNTQCRYLTLPCTNGCTAAACN